MYFSGQMSLFLFIKTKKLFLCYITIKNGFQLNNSTLRIVRVSTKWLNLLRKVCAIFAQIFFANFCDILAHETQWVLRYFFLRNLRKTENIFSESCAWNEILVLRNFFAQFAQNRKFYAKCNFLDKLSKIDILNNWRFISYIKKY